MLLSGCKSKTKTESADSKVLTQEQLIQRGDYLVTTTGCNDFHTPKRMGQNGLEIIPELMFSGYQANEQLQPIDKTFREKVGCYLLVI